MRGRNLNRIIKSGYLNTLFVKLAQLIKQEQSGREHRALMGRAQLLRFRGRTKAHGGELEILPAEQERGREEEDQSSIGLYLHKEKPAMQLKTHAAYSTDFEIPPNVSSHAAMGKYVFEKDSYLFEMSPHMHLRGASFKFEALYPNGKRETLLSVPNYDFKWQHTYSLKQPKRMVKGTWIICTGTFDNSSRNPANPNPNIPVYWGDQSFNEMFIGFMGVAPIPKDDKSVAAR